MDRRGGLPRESNRVGRSEACAKNAHRVIEGLEDKKQ
jgi:hypothetical protein